jgi:hypothetical protein
VSRLVAVPMSALLAMSACGLGSGSSDCPGGAKRCSENALQSCYADEMFGKVYWHTVQTCPPSMVCRLDATGPGAEPGTPLETGCFAPNAYCQEGSTRCGSIGNLMDPVLWSCALQSSDQTIRWSKTDCSAQIPSAVCLASGGTTSVPACYEVVRKCPASDTHCEGNVLFTCSGFPTLTDNQAVFDWITMDCALTGQVCRVVPQAGPTCSSP